MCLILILFSVTLTSHTIASESCEILNHFIYPNRVLRPDYPKNDVCRYRETPHCCTRSVEAVMKQYANTDAHTLFFGNLMRMRDLTSDQFYSLQNLQLPYLSERLRLTALEYRLLDNLSTSRSTLMHQATVDFIDIYYNVGQMPNFCKANIIEQMKPHVNTFLQELIFAQALVESNWNVANDLFAVVFSSKFSNQCVNDLIRAGMTRISCKTCTDHTIKIATCFDYCTDVVSSCLEPYQPVIELINQWFNLYVQVQDRLVDLIHYDRFLLLREKLEQQVELELQDEFYADVCQYHFQGFATEQASEYDTPETLHNTMEDGRRKRIAKTAPHTQIYSTRYISFAPTSETPPVRPIMVAGNQLFDPDMICFNATKSITNWGCWNGEGMGTYNRSRIPTTETAPPSTFDIHIPRLKSKISDLITNVNNELIIELTPETNEVEDNIAARTEASHGHGPNFKNSLILLIVLTWIKLMN